MQTYLPYPDFDRSARVLDATRLRVQRLDAYELHSLLTGVKRWRTADRAAKLWRGYELQLARYGLAISLECERRGFSDTFAEWFMFRAISPTKPPLPPWFGDPAFHAAHRAALLRQDPIYYSQFDWTDDPSLPYLWPV